MTGTVAISPTDNNKYARHDQQIHRSGNIHDLCGENR